MSEPTKPSTRKQSTMSTKTEATIDTKGLEKAIDTIAEKLDAHIDELREADHGTDEEQRSRENLRAVQSLLGCLRRLVKGRTLREVHDAFGAPGDFGYSHPIGKALRKIYGC